MVLERKQLNQTQSFKLLNASQVAKLIGLNRQYASDLMRTGMIKSKVIGQRLYTTQKWVENYINE